VDLGGKRGKGVGGGGSCSKATVTLDYMFRMIVVSAL